MRSNYKLLLILICLLSPVRPVLLLSQPIDYIDGKILSSVNSEPVRFATVLLKENKLGVYANADGDFKIIRNPDFHNDSVIITCIGYKRHSVALKDLSDNKVNIISLSPAIYGLGEVKIIASKRKLSSITIINRAIKNIKNNYPEYPFSYISYYRDYQKKDGKYINLNEAIIHTVDKGFNNEEVSNKYRLLDFRKNMDFPRMGISPFYETTDLTSDNNTTKNIPEAKLGDQYGNELFILMVHDAVRNYNIRSFSFIETFSKNFIYNHSFSDPEAVYNNNLLLYKIRFIGNKRVVGDSLKVSGALYIQPKDYSIHKIEYSTFYLNKKMENKVMFNADIEYGYENSLNSMMSLKYISFNNIFNVEDTIDNTYFRLLDSYWNPSNYSKNTIVLVFNNKVDPVSASRKHNYEIKVGKINAKVLSVQVAGKKLLIKLKDDKFDRIKHKCTVNIHDISDTDGNILNKRKSIELYQYRELFVQEYNKSVQFADSCFIGYNPLEENCISRSTGVYNYWMNTPENINIVK